MGCGCGGSCGCDDGQVASAQPLEFSARPPHEISNRLDALEAAVLGLAKQEFRFFSKEERDADAKSGDALPDGSFPIEDEEDLKNAIHLVHMAKDEGRAKAHIRSKASAMGMESKIPKDW